MQLVMEYQQKRLASPATDHCNARGAWRDLGPCRSQEEMLAKQQQLQREHIEDRSESPAALSELFV